MIWEEETSNQSALRDSSTALQRSSAWFQATESKFLPQTRVSKELRNCFPPVPCPSHCQTHKALPSSDPAQKQRTLGGEDPSASLGGSHCLQRALRLRGAPPTPRSIGVQEFPEGGCVASGTPGQSFSIGGSAWLAWVP